MFYQNPKIRWTLWNLWNSGKSALNMNINQSIFSTIRFTCYTLLVASRRYAFASTFVFQSLLVRSSRHAVAVSARSFGLAACRGSALKKETGGNVRERERFHVLPVPEGKRKGRAFIYISFESGRPVITAAALALFFLLFLFSPREVFLSFSSRSVYLLLAARTFPLSFFLSIYLFHLDTTTSINPDNADTSNRPPPVSLPAH